MLVTGALAFYTKRLFAATKTLAGDAKDSSERQLRAYIGVQSNKMEGLKVGEQPCAILQIHNFGHTPATEVMVRIAVVFGDPTTIDFSADNITDDFRFSFMPNMGIPAIEYLPTLADQAVIDSLAITGKEGLFVFGDISYVDAFKTKRVTRFRYQASTKHHIHGLMLCSKGNEIE